MNITIEQLKQQLNIESDFVDDDAYLQQLIDVAILSTKNYLGSDALTGYTDTTIPISIEHAVIMLAGHLYVTRTPVAFAQAMEIPYSYQFLLNPYKDYTIV